MRGNTCSSHQPQPRYKKLYVCITKPRLKIPANSESFLFPDQILGGPGHRFLYQEVSYNEVSYNETSL